VQKGADLPEQVAHPVSLVRGSGDRAGGCGYTRSALWLSRQ
jgi:hypothetical protein